MAIAAGDLAWELMPGRLLLAVIPCKIMVAASEVDVLFMEDSRPLETSTLFPESVPFSAHSQHEWVGKVRSYHATSDKFHNDNT